MTTNPRYRLSTEAALAAGAALTLKDNAAHYLATVLRLQAGDVVALFNRTDGEWCARITEVAKKSVTLKLENLLRPPAAGVGLMVCFAPIKGGRLETIIEKATELGASVLQPVITQRTIVDKVNIDRAYAIAREAAEQCERTDWPEIREPMKLLKLLGDWPTDVPLIYGDESGDSASITELLFHEGGEPPFAAAPLTPSLRGSAEPTHRILSAPSNWAVLSGPEGGFTPEEFLALTRVPAAKGVGLGPRILRADTASITLAAITLAAWGDWHSRPRFTKE